MNRLLGVFMFLVSVPAFAQVANPAVTQANIRTTICKPGWTKTVRPSVGYTARIKRQELVKQGLSPSLEANYELDHVIPLEVGGHPTDRGNLRLEPWPEARLKDQVESRVKREVCSGKRTLASGRACFVKGWKTC